MTDICPKELRGDSLYRVKTSLVPKKRQLFYMYVRTLDCMPQPATQPLHERQGTGPAIHTYTI